MKWTDKLPDADEVTENYEFSYSSSTRLTAHRAFETHSIQDVLDNFLIFLQSSGFSYAGEITLESKDGTKTWTT